MNTISNAVTNTEIALGAVINTVLPERGEVVISRISHLDDGAIEITGTVEVTRVLAGMTAINGNRVLDAPLLQRS